MQLKGAQMANQKLYKITLRTYPYCYSVAEDPTSAYEKVKEYWKTKYPYNDPKNWELDKIEFLAETNTEGMFFL